MRESERPGAAPRRPAGETTLPDRAAKRNVFALRTCSFKSGNNTISNHRSFKFTKHTQRLIPRLPGGRYRVNPLLIQIKIDAQVVQFV